MTLTPIPSTRTRSREELADYLAEIGATLASYGCPSNRLEDVIRKVANVEGYHAEPFALPTGLFLRLVPKEGAEVHRMVRLGESAVDLERLTLIDEIFNEVVDHTITIEDARARIREVAKKPPHWSKVLVWGATTISSATAAVFFRGNVVDILMALIVGAVIGGARSKLAEHPDRRLINDFLGGLFATSCAGLATLVWPTASPEVIVLAGSISLFPGLTFTTGLAEVAQKNLVSGGARLMDAAVTLLLIGFGAALVVGFQQMVGLHVPIPPKRVGLGLPFQALALVVSSLSFAFMMQVPKKYLWGALLSGATAYAVTALLANRVPTHIAAFSASLAVCVLANALARTTQRPAQLFQIPGMMLLVPGSFGFVSLGDLLNGKVEAGVAKGFEMALVAVGIVIGVLVANVVMPARKLL